MRFRGESHFLKEVEQRGTILELLSAEHPKAVNSFTDASEALLEAAISKWTRKSAKAHNDCLHVAIPCLL